MIYEIKKLRIPEKWVPLSSLLYGLLTLALLFTGFYAFFFEVSYCAIGYLVYKSSGKNLTTYWRAWISCTIIGVPFVIISFLISPILGVLVSLVVRFLILYFWREDNGPESIYEVIIKCGYCSQKNRVHLQRRGMARCGGCKQSLE